MIRSGYKASAEQFGPSDFCTSRRLPKKSASTPSSSAIISSPGGTPAGTRRFAGVAWCARRIDIAHLMGTSVLTPSFRYHPSIVAQAFGTLGSMFPGRVILGVGTGESLNEVPATGIVWPEFKERFARFRESLSLIRKLWSEERVSFQGDFYQTENATIYDRPEQPVPIYVAAAGAAGRQVCRPHRRGLYLHERQGSPSFTRNAAADLRARSGCRTARWRKDRPHDRNESLIRYRSWARHGGHATLGGAGAVAGGENVGRGPARNGAARRRIAGGTRGQTWIVSTDPDEQVELIKPYVDLGFRHLVFHAPGPDQERFLRFYAKDVLPRLRKRFG